MPPQIPAHATDADLIAIVDGWAGLLEAEDYQAAFEATEHVADMGWTPDLIRRVIKAYGDADPAQRVTVAGEPTDVTQRKEVYRYEAARPGGIGYVWYDLNINRSGHRPDCHVRYPRWTGRPDVGAERHTRHVNGARARVTASSASSLRTSR